MSENSDTSPSGNPEKTNVTGEAPHRRGGGGLVFTAVILSVVAAAATSMTAPLWSQGVARFLGVPDPLTATVKRLEGEDARLSKALAEVEARTGTLAQQVGAVVRESDGTRSADLRSVAMALAVDQLRYALRRPAPFEIELATLRAVAGNDAEVSKAIAGFAAASGTGIPLRRQLRDSFSDTAGEVLRTEQGSAQARWYDPWMSVVAHVRYAVNLDTPPSNSPAAVLQQARARLASDDLAGAVDEMGKLQGAAAEAAKPWMTEAGARLAADRGITALTTLVLSRLDTGAAK